MIQGTLGRLHLGDLLQWLHMGSLSGRLTLSDCGRERRLDFLEGRVVFASSQVPSERLGTWLATQGVAPPAILRQLLGASLLRRTLFTSALLDAGVASTQALRVSVTELARTLVTRSLLAPELSFTFDPAFPVRDLLNLDLGLEPNALLMEAARRTDERARAGERTPEEALPFRGEAFEKFFWELVREGFSGGEMVDGEQVLGLHRAVRDIMTTLSQWLASSPGLVPIPAGQVALLTSRLAEGGPATLEGLPHAAWNQMVLVCSVESDELPTPRTLTELEEQAHHLDLWLEQTGTDRWRRPHSERLDELSRRVAAIWSRAAAAAAPHFGLDPDTARLAAHLLGVPTDLVLWVLATLPLPHQQLRQTLVRRLPQLLGTALARRAAFPRATAELWAAEQVTALGACLNLARELLPSAPLWPTALPDGEATTLEVVSPSALARAGNAARQAIEGDADDPVTVG